MDGEFMPQHPGDAQVGLSCDALNPCVLAGLLLTAPVALANLLENAERHGEGLARLGVRSAGDEVVFEVDDHGAGFGEEAFDPFVREGSGRHPSLGLGLALVRRIAHAHGGEVSVRRLSGGARGARVELRVAARAVGVGAAPGPLAPPPERA